MKDFKQIVGNNLTYLRKSKQLTQIEVGKIFGYSDKAVSKWEQGSTLPDLETLNEICKYYEVTLDFLTKSENQNNIDDFKRNDENKIETIHRIITASLFSSIIWIIATLVFTYLLIFPVNEVKYYWLAFIWAIPLNSMLVLTFNKKYFKDLKVGLVFASLLTWTTITCIYLQLRYFGGNKYMSYNVWPLYFIGIPLQIAIILDFLNRLTKKQKMNR